MKKTLLPALLALTLPVALPAAEPSSNATVTNRFSLASWWNGNLRETLHHDAMVVEGAVRGATSGAGQEFQRAGQSLVKVEHNLVDSMGHVSSGALVYNPHLDIFSSRQELGNQYHRYVQSSGATADWFGLGAPLRQNGLTMQGVFKYVYFGQVSGGFPQSSGMPRSNFIPEVRVKFNYDFKPLLGVEGLTILSDWRYRGVAGNNPAYAAGTTGTTSSWNPTDMSSGFGMRMMQQYLQYANKYGFLNVGMENPYDQFLQQPLSKMFENNMINSTKGIGVGADGPGLPVYANNGKTNLYSSSAAGWSSSYLAWGGTLRIRPSRSTYIQSGLYQAVANATGVSQTPQFTATSVYPYASVPASYLGQYKTPYMSTPNLKPNGMVNAKTPTKSIGNQQVFSQNHGFNTAGAPNNNNTGGMQGLYTTWSGNGLYSVNEIGWTPKLGKDQLDGKYAAGYYIWGLPNCSYTPWNYDQSAPGKVAGSSYNSTVMGVYLQADQMLFRHHDSAPVACDGKSVADTKNPAFAPPKTFSDRGLYSFNQAAFSNPGDQAMPYYFQTGLVWKGLFDARPADQMGAAVGCGFYSPNFNNYQNGQNIHTQNGYANLPAYTSTQVIEGFYSVQFTKWLYVKPYAQCLVNPAGNGTLGTVWTLGARLYAVF
jgi:hypothetical protein